MIIQILKRIALSASLIASVVSASSIAYAEQLKAPSACFVDVRSRDAMAAQLPAYLRGSELYAVTQSGSMTGAIKIVQAGKNFLMEAHGKHFLLGRIDVVENITQACLSGDKLSVSLSGGGSNTIQLLKDGNLKLQGVTFIRTSVVGYEQVLARLQKKK